MHTYSLIIELPLPVKNQIANLCFGPSQILWIEKQNIYFLLYSFGDLSDLELSELKENLEKLFFHSFVFNMRGIKSTKFKGKGIIGIESVNHPALEKINKDLEKLLKKFSLRKKETSPFPLVLGYYEKIDFERLIDYLMAYSTFESLPIEVKELTLIHVKPSSKGSIYEEIAYYPASKFEFGED